MKNLFMKAYATLLFFFALSVHAVAQPILPGSLAGSPDVSASGAFTYSVPLALPPGINNLMPQLALVYNSRAGNGPLGTSPAYFTVESQDGLVYEYGTSIDSRMLASAGTGEVVKWALSKILDRHGNYIAFQYQYVTSVGTHKLDKILYGGNALMGTPPSCEIDFGYQTRGDNHIRYIFGSKTEEPERMNSITIKVGVTTVHTYGLVYGYDFYSHLEKITEIGQGGNALPTTVFTYGGSVLTYAQATTSLTSDPSTTPHPDKNLISAGDFNGDGYTDIVGMNQGTTGSPAVSSNYSIYKNLKNDDFVTSPPSGAAGSVPIEPGSGSGAPNYYCPGFAEAAIKGTLDFNGDGKTDLLTVTYNGSTTSGNYVAYIHLGNGTGFDAPVGIYSNGGGTDKFQNILITTGDFLGNGKQQVLLAFPDVPPIAPTPSSSVQYTINLIGDGGFSSTNILMGHRAEFHAMDFDGDGKDELFTTLYSVIPPALSTKIYSFATSFDPATKLPISSTTVMTNPVSMGYPAYFHRVFYGDFNGDGMQDVLTWEPSLFFHWEIGYSVGKGFASLGAVSLFVEGSGDCFLALVL